MKGLTRYVLVGMLVLGMAVDTASARRLFQRRCGRPKCRTACAAPACCETAVEVSCDSCGGEAPCSACEPGAAEPSCSDCGGEEVIVTSPAPVETFEYHPEPSPAPADDPIPAPAMAEDLLPPAPLAPAPLAVPPAEEPVAELNEPAMIDEPAPVTPAPADILGDRYSGTDDLFGDDTITDEPAPTEAPTTDPEPVEEPAASDENMEDLFGEPISPPAEESAPAEAIDPEPTGPAEPAEAEPEPDTSSDIDDLFGTSQPIEPAATEVVPEPLPAEPELVEPAAVEPGSIAPGSVEAESLEPAPAEPEDYYDPFGDDTVSFNEQSAILSTDGGLYSQADRTWTDDTASFTCKARMTAVTAKHVVLERSNGAKLSVPFARLASSDLHFVQLQITALRIVRAHDTAAEQLAVTLAH